MKVIILGVKEFKGHKILLQNIGNIFQYIIFFNGEFYSGTIDVSNKNELSDKELVGGANLLTQAAVATIESLIHKDNPGELIKRHEREAAIVDVLDKNLKPKITKPTKVD